jgi:phycobilisome rod-core linker protein
MPLPLLRYPLSSQNHRVRSFEIPGDEQPRIYSPEYLSSPGYLDSLIAAAYRQIFHEQQMLAWNREVELESQFRAGQMTVRQFIRGLLLSDSFRRLNYEANSNYRFVELCLQRLLGRAPHGDREKLSLSIVLATKGIQGLVDMLLESDEYLAIFGDDIVPYQRRRLLPQHHVGELPFARVPRYEGDFLGRVKGMKNGFLNSGVAKAPEFDGSVLFTLGLSCLIAVALLLTYSAATNFN